MNYEELLKNLQHDYLMSIPDKIKTITAQIAARDTAAIRDSFHKLKGTGKTYGFPEVSELAALVERMCIDHAPVAIGAADQAIAVMHDIYESKTKPGNYSFATDARVDAIRKLLPSG